jgi:glutaredoxin
MLQIYTSTYCYYCHKVTKYLRTTDIPYEERNISENPAFRDELITLGGMMQIPFLVDTANNVHMYESDDIIAYIQSLHNK